jgi:hypothetical protein
MKKASLIFLGVLNILSITATAQDRERMNYTVEDNSELKPGENADEKIRRNFFLKAEVSKTECFVGEPLMATFKAYSRLDANSQVLKRPSLGGFSVIEMVDVYNNQPDIEKYKGENYYVHLIRKVQLFPLQPGTFTIEPAEVESVIHLRKSSGRLTIRDLFRRRGSDATIDRQLVFKTPPVDIKVNALPEKDQPADYSGAVGDFMIHVQMADTAVVAREPAIVKLIVSGTGNFPLVTEPRVNWPSSAEISGPTVTEQVNKYAYPLSGLKSFQFTIGHRDSGTFTIPPVKFSYFDPASKKYKIARSNEMTYTVSITGKHSNKNREEIIFKNERQTPLHYYYFAIIAVAIVSLIIYFLVRPPGKN